MRGVDKTSRWLVLVSGVLQVLVFPAPGLSWLCWIALAPLIIMILSGGSLDGAPPGSGPRPVPLRAGFLAGYASGVLWYLGSCYWIFHVMHSYGGLAAPVAAGVLVLFCLYLGLYHGLFGFLLAWTAGGERPGRALLLAPFLWVAVELARARITGFPWDLLGTAQVDNVGLTRLATITGVYGVSLEIAMVNAAFAAVLVVPRTRRLPTLIAALVVSTLLQGGKLVQPAPAPADRTATLVQLDLPILEGGEWTSEYLDRTLADLARLSTPQVPAGERKPELIIWPESPAPFFATDPRFRRALSNLAQSAGSYVLAGSLGGAPTGDLLYNSAELIAPNGDWAGRYNKVHLVPWGEYVPFPRLFAFAQKLTHEVGDFSRGSERHPLNLGAYRAGVFICYESVFPDEIRQFAAAGAGVFVNISNDGWFGESGAPGQHLNMARMRAIENRRWLLRTTNTGITAAIDPYGRVVARAPRNQRVVLQAPYAALSEQTFYTRHGDWFAWACAIISLAGLILSFRPNGLSPWSKN